MMTCMLSLPPLITNPFSEGGVDKQRSDCEHFDYNWINSNPSHSELCIGQRGFDSCQVGTCIGTSISRAKDKGSDVNVDYFNKKCETGSTEIEPQKEMCHFNFQNAMKSVGGKEDKLPDQSSTRSQGIKRKSDTNDCTLDYIPTKRISPFLNTPKQRKDDRKKILKISIRKIKELNDPEIFLRRTVLVNNTMKRLQSELREEKVKTKRRKSFNLYGVPQNNCFSDLYLCDDPFLSGVNEEITDDMTDTLINNVFHDKSSDDKKEIVSETSDRDCNDMDISENRNCVDARLATPINSSDERSLPQGSGWNTDATKTPMEENCNLTRVTNYRTDLKEEMDASGSSDSKEIHDYKLNI